ncbi:unnamed protein product [Cunninghamella blakesleeana]
MSTLDTSSNITDLMSFQKQIDCTQVIDLFTGSSMDYELRPRPGKIILQDKFVLITDNSNNDGQPLRVYMMLTSDMLMICHQKNESTGRYQLLYPPLAVNDIYIQPIMLDRELIGEYTLEMTILNKKLTLRAESKEIRNIWSGMPSSTIAKNAIKTSIPLTHVVNPSLKSSNNNRMNNTAVTSGVVKSELPSFYGTNNISPVDSDEDDEDDDDDDDDDESDTTFPSSNNLNTSSTLPPQPPKKDSTLKGLPVINVSLHDEDNSNQGDKKLNQPLKPRVSSIRAPLPNPDLKSSRVSSTHQQIGSKPLPRTSSIRQSNNNNNNSSSQQQQSPGTPLMMQRQSSNPAQSPVPSHQQKSLPPTGSGANRMSAAPRPPMIYSQQQRPPTHPQQQQRPPMQHPNHQQQRPPMHHPNQPQRPPMHHPNQQRQSMHHPQQQQRPPMQHPNQQQPRPPMHHPNQQQRPPMHHPNQQQRPPMHHPNQQQSRPPMHHTNQQQRPSSHHPNQHRPPMHYSPQQQQQRPPVHHSNQQRQSVHPLPNANVSKPLPQAQPSPQPSKSQEVNNNISHRPMPPTPPPQQSQFNGKQPSSQSPTNDSSSTIGEMDLQQSPLPPTPNSNDSSGSSLLRLSPEDLASPPRSPNPYNNQNNGIKQVLFRNDCEVFRWKDESWYAVEGQCLLEVRQTFSNRSCIAIRVQSSGELYLNAWILPQTQIRMASPTDVSLGVIMGPSHETYLIHFGKSTEATEFNQVLQQMHQAAILHAQQQTSLSHNNTIRHSPPVELRDDMDDEDDERIIAGMNGMTFNNNTNGTQRSLVRSSSLMQSGQEPTPIPQTLEKVMQCKCKLFAQSEHSHWRGFGSVQLIVSLQIPSQRMHIQILHDKKRGFSKIMSSAPPSPSLSNNNSSDNNPDNNGTNSQGSTQSPTSTSPSSLAPPSENTLVSATVYSNNVERLNAKRITFLLVNERERTESMVYMVQVREEDAGNALYDYLKIKNAQNGW